MKILVFLTLILFPGFLIAQKMNEKTPDPIKGNEMMIGYCNRDGFSTINSDFDSAYKAEYPLYHTDAETMKQLAGKLNGIKITVIMATWCGDSKEWVPRFYKIMDELKFDYNNLTLISVDHSKKALGTNVDEFKAELVPTFIFYRNNAELGRIIETPGDLLEKEMLKILSK